MKANNRNYDGAFEQLGAVNAVFPESAKRQMSQMVEQIARTDRNVQQIIGTEQSIPIKGGFIAEELHAETFNLESILQRKGVRTFTDRYEEWAKLGMRGNDPTADLVASKGDEIINRTQVKYYQDAEKTANALRQHRDGVPHYNDADSFIAPADQVNPSDGSMSISSYARRTELKNAQTRPEVSEAARQVNTKTSDRLAVDGVESKPVTKAQAHDVAKGNQSGEEFRQEYQHQYMTRSTLQQMKRSACAAAAITAVAVGTINTVRCLKLVKEGKITPEEASIEIIKNTAVASADSALKAAAAAGAVSLAVKQGASLVATQTFSGLMATNAIAGGSICGVDLIKCIVLVAAGKMTLAELEERTGKNIFATGAGVTGSALGMSLMAGSSIAFAPVAGSIAGGLIAGIAMQFAIENHIEKPYKEIMRNTELLKDCGITMHETAHSFLMGQQIFQAFLEKEQELDINFAVVSNELEDAKVRMKQAIDNL